MMRIGVMMHVTDTTATVAELAREAESRGFESVFVTEHTHIPVRPFIPWRDGQSMPESYKRLYDPIVGLATAVATTTTIKLGTGVLVLGQREPLATAKQLASLDRLSGGRFVCGVGFGWLRPELENHGIEWNDRQAALWERLAAIRALWSQDEAEFAGSHVRFGPTWSYPKPVQASGPPVLLGAAGTPRNFDDIVRHADGWMPIEGTEDIATGWKRLLASADEMRRDPKSLELTIYAASGEARLVQEHRSTGASRVVIGIDPGDLDHVRRQLDRHAPILTSMASKPAS